MPASLPAPVRRDAAAIEAAMLRRAVSLPAAHRLRLDCLNPENLDEADVGIDTFTHGEFDVDTTSLPRAQSLSEFSVWSLGTFNDQPLATPDFSLGPNNEHACLFVSHSFTGAASYMPPGRLAQNENEARHRINQAWQSAPAVHDFFPSHRFGPVFGVGSHATVFNLQSCDAKCAVCHLGNDSRPICVKITKNSEGNPLYKEIGILSLLNHPNVIQLLCQTADSYVMERHSLDIFSVFRRLGKPRGGLTKVPLLMPSPLLSFIMKDAVAALDHVHACGVIHGDIKLDNFLIAKDGRVLLADFGCAQLAHQEGNRFSSALDPHNAHRWPHMAPEAFVKNSVITFAMDVYGLGFVCQELLSRSGDAHSFRPPLSDAKRNNQVENEAKSSSGSESMDLSQLTVSTWKDDAKDFVRQCMKGRAADRPTVASLVDHAIFQPPCASRRVWRTWLLREIYGYDDAAVSSMTELPMLGG